MKSKKLILPGIFAVLINFTHSIAQDTIIEYNNYKWKIGGKFIFDKASNYNLTPSVYYVNNFGIEVSRKLNKFEIESGIYKITRVQDHGYYVPPHINPIFSHYVSPVYYYFLSLPVNVILNTKVFYFGVGSYIDYLVDQRDKIKSDDIVIYTTDQRKFNFGFSLTLGLDKSITKNSFFFVEGRYMQNLLDNNQVYNGIYLGYTNFGIATGINYKFLN